MNTELMAKINLTLFYGLCMLGVLWGNTQVDVACFVASNVATVVYFKWMYE